jgi:hypothetical protein
MSNRWTVGRPARLGALLCLAAVVAFGSADAEEAHMTDASEKREIPPFPSIEEFSGFYNVTLKDVRRMGYEDATEKDIYRVFASLPPLRTREFHAVRRDTLKALERHAARVGPQNRIEGYWSDYESYYALDQFQFFIDRTVKVELDVRLLDERLIADLQDLLATRHPAWRIAFVGDTPEDAILIYPESVRFGREHEKQSLKESLASVCSKELTRVRRKYRSLNLEMAVIRQRLPGVLGAMGRNELRVLGWFPSDNAEFESDLNRDGDWANLWVVETNSPWSEFVPVADSAMTLGSYHVLQDGDLVEFIKRSQQSNVRAVVSRWRLFPGSDASVEFRREDTGESIRLAAPEELERLEGDPP